MANISKIKTPDGNTFNIIDSSVPSWAKQASKPTYTASEVGALPDDTEFTVTVGGPNSVGTAKVGTAKTVVPAYTPSGVIKLSTTETEAVSGASLNYSLSNDRLYINGVTLQMGKKVAIPTGATFEGNGVTFNIEEEN